MLSASVVGTPHHGFTLADSYDTDAIVRQYTTVANQTPHTQPSSSHQKILSDEEDEGCDPFQVEILARTSRWILKQAQAPKPVADVCAEKSLASSGDNFKLFNGVSPDMKLGVGFANDPFEESFSLDLSFSGPTKNPQSIQQLEDAMGLTALKEMLSSNINMINPSTAISPSDVKSKIQQKDADSSGELDFSLLKKVTFDEYTYYNGDKKGVLANAAAASSLSCSLPPPDPVGRYLPRRLFPIKKSLAKCEKNPEVVDENLRVDLYRQRIDTVQLDSADSSINSSFSFEPKGSNYNNFVSTPGDEVEPFEESDSENSENSENNHTNSQKMKVGVETHAKQQQNDEKQPPSSSMEETGGCGCLCWANFLRKSKTAANESAE